MMSALPVNNEVAGMLLAKITPPAAPMVALRGSRIGAGALET